MKESTNKEANERKKALLDEASRRDWFGTILEQIDHSGKIYSDPRIKGYVIDTHESLIKSCISLYLKDSELQKSALDYLAETKREGERKKIKIVEKNLKNLESVLRKEIVPLETKEKLINRAEDEIKSQIPEEIREVYVEMTSWMRERYLKKNE
jgi:hypothetical protein